LRLWRIGLSDGHCTLSSRISSICEAPRMVQFMVMLSVTQLFFGEWVNFIARSL
jgi:hypothetical protein